ncbi:MAG: asparaginase domain-containing protein [Candidatus Komeilibacteria bacterium]
MAKNRVLIIYLDVRNSLKQADLIASKMPELDLLAEIVTLPLKVTEDCSQLESWQAINETIYTNYDRYDGFVVVSKADNLIYSAVATDTAFEKNYKPIIFTTALLSGGGFKFKKLSDLSLKTNLINALQIINSNISDVMIVYGQKAILATLARKVSVSHLNSYDSLTGEYIATVDFSLELFAKPNKKNHDVIFKNDFDDRIALLYLHPGFVWSKYKEVLKKSKALIIKSTHSDGLLDKDIKWLKDNFGNKPIIIYNRLGIVREQPLPANYITTDRMSWETMIIRTMWCLAASKSTTTFKKIFFPKQ